MNRKASTLSKILLCHFPHVNKAGEHWTVVMNKYNSMAEIANKGMLSVMVL